MASVATAAAAGIHHRRTGLLTVCPAVFGSAIQASARLASRADWKRSSGSLAKQVLMMRSSPVGSTGSRSCAARMPVVISYSTRPNA